MKAQEPLAPAPPCTEAGNGCLMVLSTMTRSGVWPMVQMLNSGPSEDSGAALCTTREHLGDHAAKIRDALVENPEFLNSGMLGGEDLSLNTGSKTPPIGTGRWRHPRAFPSSGFREC